MLTTGMRWLARNKSPRTGTNRPGQRLERAAGWNARHGNNKNPKLPQVTPLTQVKLMKPNYKSKDAQPSETDVHDRKMALYIVIRQRFTPKYIRHLAQALDALGCKLSQDLDGHADLAMASMMAMLIIKNQRMMGKRMVDLIAQQQLQPELQEMIQKALDENTKK